jgi:hypothetical protein
MFDLETSKKITAAVSAIAKNTAGRKTIKVEQSDHPDGDITRLFIDHPGISPSEISIRRNESRLEILIIPDFPDGLVPYPESNKSCRPEHTKELFLLYGHLCWSKSTAQEIHSCLRHMVSIHCDEDKEIWVERVSEAVRVVLDALVYLRDAGHEPLNADTFRNHLPLDAMIKLAFDTRLDPALRDSILGYLKQLPGYRGEDVQSKDQHPKVYEHHGYTCMQINWHLPQRSACSTGLCARPPVEAHYHTIKASYKKVEYRITPEGLVVSIYHHPKKEKIEMIVD